MGEGVGLDPHLAQSRLKDLALVIISFSQRIYTEDNCFEFLGLYKSEVIISLSFHYPQKTKQNSTNTFK